MTFQLSVPLSAGGQCDLTLEVGQSLFVLGANGTGKSSLLQRLAANSQGHSRRISASRQTWFQSSSIEFSPSQKQQLEKQARNWDNSPQSRWSEQNAGQRSGLTLYDLIDAENVEARTIANALRAGRREEAEALAAQVAPIAKINELLQLSNLPITVSVTGGDRLMATKSGSPPYGVAELSDGERNALLIAAEVLTAKDGTLLIIDEPERHLHRSIISPLLTQLFKFRQDCAFIIATHDLMLPIDSPDARVMLVRTCAYNGGQTPTGWDVDVIPGDADIDETLKQDIVGARRRIVFVEGRETSLDKPLYSVLFPNISVRSKGTAREVEQAVFGIRDSEHLHWLRSWGVIDNDGRDAAHIAKLNELGVFALPFYSVESIYYHPEVISGVATRSAALVGADAAAMTAAAIGAGLHSLKPHFSRLAARAVEKSIRRAFFSNLPTLKSIEQREPITLSINTDEIVSAEVESLQRAAEEQDWLRIVSRCPVRETPALDEIAKALGFQDCSQYQSAVLHMLREDGHEMAKVRAMFGGMAEQLNAA